MTPHEQSQLYHLYSQAVALDPSERPAFLEERVPPALRSKLERFLATDESGHPLQSIELPAAGPNLLNRRIAEHLLRKRLPLLGLVGLWPLAAFFFDDFFTGEYDKAENHTFFIFHLVTLVTVATCVAVLWRRRRSLSKAVLRVIELILMVAAAVFIFWFHLIQFERCQDRLAQPLTGPIDTVDLTNESCALRWSLLLITYAMFVPNTKGRWVIAMAILFTLPLLATSFIGVRAQAWAVVGLSFEMAVWLVMAMGLGAIGFLSINLLRGELENDRIGSYKLLGKLGQGGMGQVFLAEHELMKQQCAIKVIRPEIAAAPAYRKRFEEEVNRTAQLTHENTIRVFNCGRTVDDFLFYVMEYVSGPSLQDLVNPDDPLPPGRVVHILVQVCSALREAHRVRLFHRDLKPSNILLCERGGEPDRVKIVDFGIAQGLADGSNAGFPTSDVGIEGTPAYMAPEQIRGAGPAEPRNDIYSLGATAYSLLTGRLLFERASVGEMLRAHLQDSPVLPAYIPDDLRQILLRCLEKDPDRRFIDVGQLKDALKACACAVDWDEAKARQWWETWRARWQS